MNPKLQWLRNTMSSLDLQGLIISNPVNIKYLTNIEAEGVLDGFISTECRGTNGFGFDEIFELPNGLTLAELSPEEKNEVSARYIEIKNLKEKLD